MTPASKDIFNRAELLLGADVMERLASARVILFGVGGVGSWCAEGLVRSGITHLTIVDADDVVPSNINRQRMATVSTVGRSKVEALKAALLPEVGSADTGKLRLHHRRDRRPEGQGGPDPARDSHPGDLLLLDGRSL